MGTKWKKWSNRAKRVREFFIYVDVLLLIFVVAAPFSILHTCDWLNILLSDGRLNGEHFFTSVCGIAVEMYIFSIIRKRWRRHEFKKENCMIYVLINGFFEGITGARYYRLGFASCSKKRFRFTVCVILIFVLLYYWLLIEQPVDWGEMTAVCILAGVIVLLIYRRGTKKIIKEYEKLMIQFAEICKGNYEGEYMLEEDSIFYEESERMSKLGEQLRENLEKELQAERMKVDLITNVSHDLKTPLTSIISYVDLLSKEDLEPVAKDYVSVLADKSERLKKMIADVFELAKVTSGNAEIKKESVDVNKLLVQTLADMADEIEKAPVRVVQEVSEQTAQIEIDGQKLYRVLQNIIGNALRYAMPNTRVYVKLQIENHIAQIQVKNVAGYEMNFTKEEIVGRFVRGDKARTTEGSGLGLAIAKEFTEACGGTLELIIDGDVFCVEISFPISDSK